MALVRGGLQATHKIMILHYSLTPLSYTNEIYILINLSYKGECQGRMVSHCKGSHMGWMWLNIYLLISPTRICFYLRPKCCKFLMNTYFITK